MWCVGHPLQRCNLAIWNDGVCTVGEAGHKRDDGSDEDVVVCTSCAVNLCNLPVYLDEGICFRLFIELRVKDCELVAPR